MSVHNDKAVKKLIQQLAPFSEGVLADAAVAVLLRNTSGTLHILLTKRVSRESDPWSGHVAFPGGKIDLAKDQNLKATVMRETFEEIGIDLAETSFLGVLEPFSPANKPHLKVLPFLFVLNREPKMSLNREEINEFSWISLDEIANKCETFVTASGRGPACNIRGWAIWGMTFRILSRIISHLRR